MKAEEYFTGLFMIKQTVISQIWRTTDICEFNHNILKNEEDIKVYSFANFAI